MIKILNRLSILQVELTLNKIKNIMGLILIWITESSDILNSIKWLKNNDSLLHWQGLR
jgi:hypothetical protein